MTPLLLIFAIGACNVVDGDTIKCRDERIRLLRIDSVERGEPGFTEAKQYLATLIDGREVFCTTRARDRYHRILAECATDDTPSLSNAMLASGLAQPYQKRKRPRRP